MKRSCTQIATAAATLCIGNSKHMDHIIFASLPTYTLNKEKIFFREIFLRIKIPHIFQKAQRM